MVLLGASNLFLALPEALARLGGRDLSFHVAHGPGRSYGLEAGALGVRFRGILDCGILEALEEAHASGGPLPTWALLTDVGNDILYQSGVARLLAWLDEISSRLLALGAEVAITSLPLSSVESIPLLLYRVLRAVYFPFRPTTKVEALRQMREIQEGLGDLSRRRGVRLLPTRSSWYGFDRFHLRRRARREAFSTWLGEVLPPAEAGAAGVSLALAPARLRFHRPAEYLVLARRVRRRQEGLAIAPGARLFAY